MFPLADYHLHTPLCGHAVGEAAEYVAGGRAAGLAEIGFSDHCPMPGPEPFDDWRMSRAELPLYIERVLATRAAAAPFPVRLGLECEFIHGCEHWIDELAALAPWDYLIGSVHYLAPGWDVDNPKWLGRFNASDTAVEEIWDLYWREFRRCAKSGLFDLLAHPDLVKKFGHRPAGDLRRYYDPAVAALAHSGVAIEVSTAGLRKPAGELYPAQSFLELTCAAGVPVVVSSDAHAPGEVGRDFDLALQAVRDAGYTRSSRFEGRRRSEVAL